MARLVTGLPLLALGAAAWAQGCTFEYRIKPQFNARVRGFEVSLSFDAGTRRETALRLHDGFAGIKDLSAALSDWSAQGEARVRPADEPGTWHVEHPARQRITVRYRVRAALPHPDGLEPQAADQQYRPQVGGNWLQFLGYAALVDVGRHLDVGEDEAGAPGRPPRSCLRFEGLPQNAPVLSSHGVVRDSGVIAVEGLPSELLRGFYGAGPGWRVTTRRLRSGNLHVAVRGHWAMTDDHFTEQVARMIDAQRQFWGNESHADQLVALTPNQAAGVRHSGLRVYHAAVLHAARDFQPDTSTFRELIAHENLHEWIPGRLGRSRSDGQSALDHWFSEGFTDYYTHRLLLRTGMWSLQRYGNELTSLMRQYRESALRNMRNADIARQRHGDRDIAQLPYLRGEFLALRWDAALRARGHAGLDAIMRGLLLPPGSDATETAAERLLAALKPMLGDAPREDVVRFVEEGGEFDFGPDTLGPCFQHSRERVRPWSLGFAIQSFETRRIAGVDPHGPAAAAGVRDGMSLAGWSLPGRDSGSEVELWIYHGAGGDWFRIAYQPLGSGLIEQPRYRARAAAQQLKACSAWLER